MKTNKTLTIALLLCTAGVQSLWSMQDFAETKKTTAAVEEQKTTAQETESKAAASFFNEKIQARLALKHSSSSGKAFIPAQMKNLISSYYPISEKALSALNEYSIASGSTATPICYDAATHRVAFAGKNKVLLLNMLNGRLTPQNIRFNAEPFSLSFNAAGTGLYVSLGTSVAQVAMDSLRVSNIFAPSEDLLQDSALTNTQESLDGKSLHLLICSRTTSKIVKFNLSDGSCEAPFMPASLKGYIPVQLHRNGTCLMAPTAIDPNEEDKPIDFFVYDFEKETTLATIKVDVALHPPKFSDDGNYLVIIDKNNNKLTALDIKTAKKTDISVTFPNKIMDVTLSSDNKYIIWSSQNGRITCKRINELDAKPTKLPFEPKLLPFVDWLYTTQKERGFKPLTLTQEGLNIFKQLDPFSQTALKVNLKICEPGEETPMWGGIEDLPPQESGCVVM